MDDRWKPQDVVVLSLHHGDITLVSNRRDGLVTAIGECILCEQTVRISDVDPIGLLAWRAGRMAQDVLSDLSSDDREFLISGACSKCFNEMFGDSTHPRHSDNGGHDDA